MPRAFKARFAEGAREEAVGTRYLAAVNMKMWCGGPVSSQCGMFERIILCSYLACV